MAELEKWEEEGVLKAISKKEASRLTKEMNRLRKLLSGIRDMKTLPDILFIIDPVDTQGAVKEAKILGIPVVAVCDTNADPDDITVPVPGNDDAARSIKLFCMAVADSIIEGRNEANGANAEQKAEAEAAQEPVAEEKPVENPVMAEALSAAVEETKKEVVAEAEAIVAEKAEEAEVKEEAKEEKAAKKPAAKKTTAAKKPAAKKTTVKKTAKAKEETKEEAEKPSEEAAA